MEKLVSLLLTLLMLLSVASCSGVPQEDYDNLQLRLQEKEALVASLQTELTNKENANTELKDENIEMSETLNKKNQVIDDLTDQVDEYSDFKDTYGSAIETYINPMVIGGTYWQRTQNLPEYKEGSLTLEPQTGWVLDPLGYFFNFERKYRLSYYGIVTELPLEKALRIVRGQANEPTFLFDPVRYYIRSVETWENYSGEPIMHYYSWFILAYQVSREEMEQIVDLLSNLDSEVYRGYSEEEKQRFDFTHEYYELPNVNVLYTFDADIINEYYRYA